MRPVCQISSNRWYIEFKKGWHGVGPDWNTKPKERLKEWLKDVAKLLRIGHAAGHRAFGMARSRQHALSSNVARFDEKEIEAAGKFIADHVKAGGSANDIPLPHGRFNGWQSLWLLESTLMHLGKADFEVEGQLMEWRDVVACF